MNFTPIILFAYNRPKHLEATLQALSENEEAAQSILYIYCDGAKANADDTLLQNITAVQTIAKNENRFKQVIVKIQVNNKGLANSVIEGVSEVIAIHKKIIVLEDDLIVGKQFLNYMNTALEKYETEENVKQISGHCYPLEYYTLENKSYFLPFTTSWGWATWQRAWFQFEKNANGFEKLKLDSKLKFKFNIDGIYPYTEMLINQIENKTIDSWAIRWYWSVFKNNGLVLFPDNSLINNIGFDIEATHTKGENPFANKIFNTDYKIIYFPNKIIVDRNFFFKIKQYLKYKTHKNSKFKISDLINLIKNKFKLILKPA